MDFINIRKKLATCSRKFLNIKNNITANASPKSEVLNSRSGGIFITTWLVGLLLPKTEQKAKTTIAKITIDAIYFSQVPDFS